MKKLSGYLLFSLVMLWTTSCNVEPRPIAYGEHNCDYCEMTIMDNRYGSEIVTDKGKVYMFDAIECMVNFKKKEMPAGESPELFLVTSYEEPGQLINAEKGIIIHSPGLPSPMGMYLTAFGNSEIAEQMKEKHGGTLYDWEKLLSDFDKVREGFERR